MKHVLVLAFALYLPNMKTLAEKVTASTRNACPKVNTYRVGVRQSQIASAIISHTTTCLGIPPVCTKYRTRYYVQYTTVYETKTNITYECCPGYIQKEYRFFGARCIRCRRGWFGKNCSGICRCQNGWCHYRTGRCYCNKGWTGHKCDTPCPKGTKCRQDCSSENGGTYDAINGICHCPPGFSGQRCEEECEEGTWGPRCSNKCECASVATCVKSTGECICPPECSNGTFGERCKEKCPVCPENATCNAICGFCECPSGYKGRFCNEACPSGYYGVMCSEKCDCGKGFYCSPVSGCVQEENRFEPAQRLKITKLVTILGPIFAVMILVTVIVLWIVCRCKEKRVKEESIFFLSPGKGEAPESSLPCSTKNQEQEYRRLKNNYEKNPLTSNSPYPILEPLYEDVEDLHGKKCSDSICGLPKRELNESESSDAVYEEVKYGSNLFTDVFNRNYTEYDDAESSICPQDNFSNHIYGMEEDKQERTKSGSSQLRLYSRLNLGHNKRDPPDSYDRLERPTQAYFRGLQLQKSVD